MAELDKALTVNCVVTVSKYSESRLDRVVKAGIIKPSGTGVGNHKLYSLWDIFSLRMGYRYVRGIFLERLDWKNVGENVLRLADDVARCVQRIPFSFLLSETREGRTMLGPVDIYSERVEHLIELPDREMVESFGLDYRSVQLMDMRQGLNSVVRGVLEYIGSELAKQVGKKGRKRVSAGLADKFRDFETALC